MFKKLYTETMSTLRRVQWKPIEIESFYKFLLIKWVAEILKSGIFKIIENKNKLNLVSAFQKNFIDIK